MLFAIEWIREQLARIDGFVAALLGGLTLDSMSAFLTRMPLLLVFCILVALFLWFLGYRYHALASGLIGGVALGVLGWHIGVSINPAFLSAGILWALVCSLAGFFLFHILHPVVIGAGAFLACWALLGQFFALRPVALIAIGAVFGAVYTIVLLRYDFIRTPISGSALLAALAWPYFHIAVAPAILAAGSAGGILLQNKWRKQYEQRVQGAKLYKPSAPAPPTPDEIAAELAEEEAARAKQAYAWQAFGDAHAKQEAVATAHMQHGGALPESDGDQPV